MKNSNIVFIGYCLLSSFISVQAAEVAAPLPGNGGRNTLSSDKDPGHDMASIPGGFTEIPIRDPEALAAAKFAVTAHDPKLKLASIEKAERQIVAGTNYRMTIQVSDSGKERRANVVVWCKLDGQRSLTSWTWLAGAPARPARK